MISSDRILPSNFGTVTLDAQVGAICSCLILLDSPTRGDPS
jgi:hypothetical protein